MYACIAERSWKRTLSLLQWPPVHTVHDGYMGIVYIYRERDRERETWRDRERDMYEHRST